MSADDRRLRSAHERCLLALVVLIFALAGWKIAQRGAIAAFVSPVATDFSTALETGSAPRPWEQRAQFVSSAPGLAVHAASLVELRDGSLRAVWFAGSREGAADVAIRSAVLNPQTGQWGTDHLLIDRSQVQHGLWRYVKKIGNPVIARAPDGSLLLWMVNVSLGGWAGSAISWSRSSDEGVTWTPPRRLVTSPFLNISTLVKGAPFAYADGQIGLPVYHEFITKFAEVLRLDAAGHVLDKQRIAGSQTQLQPVVVVDSARSAQMYMRSGRAQQLMRADTDDGGKTWSAAYPTAWPNPDAAVAATVAASPQSPMLAEQWLALNPTHQGRDVLALLHAPLGGSLDAASPWPVEASTRPGMRWPQKDYEQVLRTELQSLGTPAQNVQAYLDSAKRQLCQQALCSQEFSYPYLLRTRDGALHLLYTWQRTRIKHVRLSPAQGMSTVPSRP